MRGLFSCLLLCIGSRLRQRKRVFVRHEGVRVFERAPSLIGPHDAPTDGDVELLSDQPLRGPLKILTSEGDVNVRLAPKSEGMLDLFAKNGRVGLHIKAGHALSLQYHERKAESIYVLAGRLHLHHAPSIDDEVTVKVLETGAAFDIIPGTVHRFEARETVTLVEVSTPELDDVVRLEDRYGRKGTSEA